MIEKKAQQVQVGRANLAAQEEVVTQPAVEVFDQRAGPVEVLAQVTECLLEGKEGAVEALMQRRSLGPIGCSRGTHTRQGQQFTQGRHWYRKLRRQRLQRLIESGGEGQQRIALVRQCPP